MADAQASGACGSNVVWVQVPSPALIMRDDDVLVIVSFCFIHMSVRTVNMWDTRDMIEVRSKNEKDVNPGNRRKNFLWNGGKMRKFSAKKYFMIVLPVLILYSMIAYFTLNWFTAAMWGEFVSRAINMFIVIAICFVSLWLSRKEEK